MKKMLNMSSLEDWYPNMPDEVWREVEIVEEYSFDGIPRISVKVLSGPRIGDIINGLCHGNLVDCPTGNPERFLEFLRSIVADGHWEYADGTDMTNDAMAFLQKHSLNGR